MTVEAIAPAKGALLEIRLDSGEKLFLHRAIVQEEGLAEGDPLTPARIAELKQKAARRRAYEYALYLLERRSYSYRELHEKLMAAEHADEEATEEALAKLMRYGFLDDARYAEQLARHFVEGKHYGLRRAEYEMRHRGLSQNDIDDALGPYDDPERISALLLELLQKKYARLMADPDDRKAREKVKAGLLRRGYSWQQIRFAMEDYDALAEEATEAE